ncbi:hypothetical protein GRI97_07270 [Altererythrobacter xixiisoli]|uniref:Uncharacterized protein n=1 Tax=Croceibacterium xixiisoli TaxID=1476466 RepID=A0A6I4TWS3_9SPHN|nr:hypothetical protein [Croceibacterium xixiisoli]MXO98783.1 hypothetical protein [Croceibacterium xixiisoli]
MSGYSGFGAVVCHAINLVVGADGHLQQCQAVSSQAPSALTQVACGMVGGWNRMVEDGAGQPAPHVTRLHDRFREEEPAVFD